MMTLEVMEVGSTRTYLSGTSKYVQPLSLLAGILLVVSGCVVSPPDIAPQKENITTINETNETDAGVTIIEESKISNRLKGMLETMKPERIHVAIQFDPSPSTPEEKAALEQCYGIKFLIYNPSKHWYVVTPVNRIYELVREPTVVSIEEITPEEKMFERHRKGLFYPHEIKGGDIVTVSVVFFS